MCHRSMNELRLWGSMLVSYTRRSRFKYSNLLYKHFLKKSTKSVDSTEFVSEKLDCLGRCDIWLRSFEQWRNSLSLSYDLIIQAVWCINVTISACHKLCLNCNANTLVTKSLHFMQIINLNFVLHFLNPGFLWQSSLTTMRHNVHNLLGEQF